ncbi:MAG TPA: UDP-N-acetylglucosamine 2-epimerase (non-hydrolyzing) [Gammaproteobacteria bacterium]|nr:UDP-N-acetylglucosamine 2-epimerase (non-hydrolyzing) [Gammaproteobacteria bacterium]
MKLLTVVGARPQFVKAAPVSRALAEAGIEEALVHTGQHHDARMSQVFFDELGIPSPRHNLEIHGGGHGDMTGRMLLALEPVVVAERPDMVLVYGDTNSTLAGALVASKLHIPVAHVEAGLRSFNRRMPEEVNRILTDHVSALLLCPTRTAVDNLAAEGITRGVYHVGDVMYDATLLARRIAETRSAALSALGVEPGNYALATVHRAENTDDPVRLAAILGWLRERARARRVVLPIHPRTRARAAAAGLSFDGIVTCEPVGYIDMARLLGNAAEVYTDSGGVQKEAYFHRTPCVTLREETEWVETVECGWNRLWQGPDYAPRRDITDYGEGRAAETIVALVQQALRPL